MDCDTLCSAHESITIQNIFYGVEIQFLINTLKDRYVI